MAVAPSGYRTFLAELKQRICSARLVAAVSVNREMVLLYWSIGRDILARQHTEGWGAKVIDRLAADLHRAFPDMTGVSARNLKYMRAFARAWPDDNFVQQVVAQLPGGTTRCCSMRSSYLASANGMRARPSRMDGAAMFLLIRSRADCSNAAGEQ